MDKTNDNFFYKTQRPYIITQDFNYREIDIRD